MADFVADLRDIRFVLFEYLKLQELQQLDKFKDFGQDDYDAITTTAYDFAKEVLAPHNATGDREGVKFDAGKVTVPAVFQDIYREYKKNSWVSAIQEAEAGGQGLPWVMGQVIHELFLGANLSFSLSVGLAEGLISLLVDFGSEELKARFIPGLMDSSWCGTMCLTEAGAGSDVGASKCTAVKQADGTYLIEGTKIFITGGDHDMVPNVIHAVLARTEGAPAGTKGLSLFIVPKMWVNDDGSQGEYNDVAVGRIEHKMGIKASPTCVMNFGENGKCRGFLLGNELDGMKIMFHMMNEARIMVGVQGLALAAASYQAALAYTKERLQGPEITQMRDPKAPKAAIIKHPDVRRMLLWQKATCEALRALLYQCAYYADQARANPDPAKRDMYHNYVELLTPICKSYGSDMGYRSCDLAVQCLGGYGYVNEYPCEQYLRDARIASIYEGTNGIQALDLVGRKLGLKGGSVLMGYLKEIGAFVDKYKAHPTVGKLAVKVGDAKNIVANLAMKFATIGMQDITYPALYASPFLDCFGDVVASFQLCQEAVIADAALTKLYKENNAATVTDKKKLVADNAEARFYHGKLMSAQFFCNSVLPAVKSRAESITSQDRSALEIEF